MGLQAAKTINKPLGAVIEVELELGVNVNKTSIGGILSNALSTDNLPLQDSQNDTQGVMLYTDYGVITPLTDVDGNHIEDTNGNNVYVKITKPSSTYIAEFFVTSAGTESAFVVTAGTYNLLVPYMFTFGTFPSDALLRGGIRGFNDVGSGGQSAQQTKRIVDVKTITATNTIPDLLHTPVDVEMVTLHFGVTEHSNQNFNNAILVAGKSVTFIEANAGYNLEAGDEVVLIYETVI